MCLINVRAASGPCLAHHISLSADIYMKFISNAFVLCFDRRCSGYTNRMVRVISVHHFVSQDIHTCEDPVAATTASPDYLLLALPQHQVEVRDLSKGGDVTLRFPTVDQARQVLHCCHGNSCFYSY